MRQRIQSYVPKIELLFKISYLCLALATFNTLIYTSPFQPILVKITLAIGVILFVVRVCDWKDYIGMPCFWAMVLFCISLAISTVCNRGYGGITENGKWIVWTGLQFFLLYVGNTKANEREIKKEFRVTANVMVAYGFIASIISLQQLITSTSYIIRTAEGEFVIGGFKWGRLWGVYTDPNYGAVFSVIVIMLALFLQKNTGKLRKTGYALAIVANLLYIIFTDSRTGEIAFICCGLFLIVGHLVWNIEDKIRGKNVVRYLLIAVAFLLVSIGGFNIVKSVYNQQLAPVFAKAFPKEPVKAKKTTQDSKKEVGRKKDLEGNISNGRFAIWQSSLEIWKTTPAVGTGYTTVLEYAKEHCPDTYMVKFNYTSAHNSFLNILLYQGMLGVAIFLLILVRSAKIIVIQLTREKGVYGRWVWYASACIGAVVIGMFFLTEGIYTNSMGAFVLWTFLGYIVRGKMPKQGEIQA